METQITVTRAQEVFAQARQIKANLIDNLLFLGELLSEAKRDEHYVVLGHGSFRSWLEAAELDMSETQAYYLARIVDKARQLGIPREQLAASKISKLKEIFTLDSETQADQIKQLVSDSSHLDLNQIREQVQAARVDDGEERLTWRNFRLTESQAAIVDQAVNRVKEEYGNTIDSETQELVDISDGRAMELICADFNANPDPMLAEINALPDEIHVAQGD